MRAGKNDRPCMGELGRASVSARVLACIAFAGLFCHVTSCHGDLSGLSSNAREDFEWFSSLGFPDVKGCPCVRLENGGSWTAKGELIRIDYITAFVLATNAGNRKLFTADLSN